MTTWLPKLTQSLSFQTSLGMTRRVINYLELIVSIVKPFIPILVNAASIFGLKFSLCCWMATVAFLLLSNNTAYSNPK